MPAKERDEEDPRLEEVEEIIDPQAFKTIDYTLGEPYEDFEAIIASIRAELTPKANIAINQYEEYLLFSTTLTFPGARNICETLYNGQLASFHSQTETNLLKNLLSSAVQNNIIDSDAFVWVGITLNQAAGAFRFVDGTDSSFINVPTGDYPWYENEPNGNTCVVYKESSSGRVIADTNSCYFYLPFVCRRDVRNTFTPTMAPSSSPTLFPTQFPTKASPTITATPTMTPNPTTQSSTTANPTTASPATAMPTPLLTPTTAPTVSSSILTPSTLSIPTSYPTTFNNGSPVESISPTSVPTALDTLPVQTLDPGTRSRLDMNGYMVIGLGVLSLLVLIMLIIVAFSKRNQRKTKDSDDGTVHQGGQLVDDDSEPYGGIIPPEHAFDQSVEFEGLALNKGTLAGLGFGFNEQRQGKDSFTTFSPSESSAEEPSRNRIVQVVSLYNNASDKKNSSTTDQKYITNKKSLGNENITIFSL